MCFFRNLALAALLLCAACSSGRQPGMATLTDADTADLVTLSLNQELALRLSSNQTTGYSWLATKIPAMLEQVAPPLYGQDAAWPGTPGAGGTEEWRFKAVARGTGILELSYQRPWEKGPAKKRRYNISVW